jgi:hypothetical protein
MTRHDASEVTDSAVQIAKNYEWISYAQISNRFILLIALNENKARNKALTVEKISEIIAQKQKMLYKVPSTLRDAEYRLKREGRVEDKNIANRSSIYIRAQE